MEKATEHKPLFFLKKKKTPKNSIDFSMWGLQTDLRENDL